MFQPSPQRLAMPIRRIRKKQVLEKLPMSKSSFHELLKRDLRFPRPTYLNGGRVPYWNEAEVDEYLASCMQAKPIAVMRELAAPAPSAPLVSLIVAETLQR